jgi:hypothetical protein
MTSPPFRSAMAHEAYDDTATAMASLSLSSNMLLMTPMASPSTVARRKQETSCLVPPTLKRKRGEDDSNSFPVLPKKDVKLNSRILKLQSQNISSINNIKNKRRMTSTSRKHPCRYRTTKGPVPILCLDDVTSRGRVLSSIQQQDRQGIPVFSLRPRTNHNNTCFQEDKEQHQGHHEQRKQDYLYDIQEQDENVPTRHPKATYTSSIVESALTIASSTVTAGNDDSKVAAVLSSPPVPPKAVKTILQRTNHGPSSCSLGETMTLQAPSPVISTPLLPAIAAAAAHAGPCNSGSSHHSFLTLSLSKRKLSFAGGNSSSSSNNSHYNNCKNSWNGGNSFQTPTCPTATSLVQSLEGLCLPSLEDVDCVTTVNMNGSQQNNTHNGRTAPATRILQQKRAPTTPQHHRTAMSTTFDYLATALRLPDIAFTGGE